MNRRTWRDEIAPIVERAIREGRGRGLDGRELLGFIRTWKPAYCSASWMYKVWLEEVRVQLGRQRPRDGTRKRRPDASGQGSLFSL